MIGFAQYKTPSFLLCSDTFIMLGISALRLAVVAIKPARNGCDRAIRDFTNEVVIQHTNYEFG
jgi:hypothetical protein